MKFWFQSGMADIEKNKWQSLKMEYKNLFTLLGESNLAISEMFRVYFFLRIYILRTVHLYLPYITLSICKNLFISDTGDWKNLKYWQADLREILHFDTFFHW